MRRRPVMRTVGTTAAIAGTATAVSGRVSRRQQAKAMESAPAPAGAPAPAPAAAPVAPGGGGISEESLASLKSLADLHDQGVLTDAEFAEQKARILGEV